MPFVKAICLIFIVNLNVYAQVHKQITLSIGQVSEISLANIENYSVSNKEVLSSKAVKAKQILYIKGKMKGQSLVTTWTKDGIKNVHTIYVLSKSGQFKILETLSNLRNFGIRGVVKGDKLVIKSDIKTIQQYRMIKELLKTNEDIILKGKLRDKVAKKIISEVHHRFFQNFYDDIRCHKQELDIVCLTTQEILADEQFLTPIKDKFRVIFRESQRFNNLKNHKLEMRIVQIERLDGKEINFGLDQIDVGLNDLIDNGPIALTQNQSIVLRDTEYNVSTLATQKILLRTKQESTVQIGSEIPFTTTTANSGNNTQWRFAGLKIAMTLEKINNRFKINYQTKLTRPMAQGNGDTYINGSAQSSSFLIQKNSPIQMFEIDLTTDDQSGRSLPLFGKIPILGKLFSSSAKFKTYKRIIAIAKLK